MASIAASGDSYSPRFLSIAEQVGQLQDFLSNFQSEIDRDSGPFIASEREAVKGAANALELIRVFLDDLNESEFYGKVAFGSLGFLVRLENLAGPLREIKAAASQPWTDGGLPPGVSRVMRNATGNLMKEFSSIPLHLQEMAQQIPDDGARRSALRLVEPYVEQVIARRVLAQAERARDETLTVLDSAKKAAGEVGSVEQAVHYKNFANSERKTANILRYSVVAILIAVTALAIATLSTLKSEDLRFAEISKLAIVLPLAVLAAYLGRESGRHRATADWSQELAMQLQTFDAFTEPIEDDVRSRLRAKFAGQVFGASTRPSVEVERGPSVSAEVIKLLETLGAVTSSIQKKSAPEKEVQ
jgi:hypothetical protein